MLDKYRVSQIIALLNEGHGIKTVARMTGVSRNTVRRFQRNIPRKGHHGVKSGLVCKIAFRGQRVMAA